MSSTVYAMYVHSVHVAHSISRCACHVELKPLPLTSHCCELTPQKIAATGNLLIPNNTAIVSRDTADLFYR
jgi:hypothetical protein